MPDISKTYSSENGNNTAVLQISEEAVGLNNFNVLNKTVSNELENDIRYFVFDMGKIDSINSSGLGILIGCLKKIKETNGHLKIINLNEKIAGIFKLTKLDSIFVF
ncbi:MAG: STAS domain-containing protein [Ignavibacteria bacterium]|nr:STAS domain-containing protein [Ignavibacteria bacterium]